MKLLHRRARPRPENPATNTNRVNERPLKICVVFDEVASGRSAEVLIRHVTSDYRCDTQSFRFDQLEAPKPGVAAARNAANWDVLVLAARGDRVLPSHIRLWLGLCLGLRDANREGALVALITQVSGRADLDSSIVEYLGTVAMIGGLAFHPRQQSSPHGFVPDSAPPARQQLRWAGLSSSRWTGG